MIAAIIPAAGASVRMGTPKALLKFRGMTFLGAILDATSAAGLHPIVVVLGRDNDKILSVNDLSGVITIETNDPAAGPIGSVKVAVRTLLNYPVDAAIVWHVDRPHVSVDTVRTLVDRERLRRGAIVLPTFQGRRGNPVVFGRQVFDDLLAAPRG